MAWIRSITADIREVLADRERRWLHASVLAAFALLPFTAFGVQIPIAVPVIGASVKLTELTLFAVLLAAVHAVATKRLRILRAPVLYALLALNAAAQFTAYSIAGDRALLLDVGIAVARYSVLVFLLVNVLRSDRLLRAVLTTMGTACLAVMAGTYVNLIVAHGALPTHAIAAIVGSGTPHVLAYALIAFGGGIVYHFVRGRRSWWGDGMFLVLAALWIQLVFVAFVKIGQIVLFAFLVMLLPAVWRQWRRAALLVALFVLVAAYRLNIVDIRNGVHAWAVESAAGIAVRRAMPMQYPVFPVSGDAVALGLHEWGGRIIARVPQPVLALAPPPTAPRPATTAIAHADRPSWLSFRRTPSATALPVVMIGAAPVAVQPLPPPEAVAPVVDYYSEANRARRNWSSSHAGDSVSVRKRGLAVGWVIGRTHPLTGIGPGQLRDKTIFDAYSEQVREEARAASPYPWKHVFFQDEEILAAPADKGIFNLFMNAWAETGAPGLLAIIGLLGIVGIQGLRALWRARRVRDILPIAVLLPLFLALVLYHQTIYMWVHPWFWTMLALTYAAARVALDHPLPRTRTR
ncbi:MAG: hypothetical protein Q7S96_02805 [bacterium]|nr:hypothetical protein [bacterium]